MNGLLQRPQVADLVFQVYGKPLHPELFDILTIRTYEREDYRLSLWITRTGHVVTWQNDDVLLTEVADAEQAVPDTRRLYAKRMRGEHSADVPCCHGIVYQAPISQMAFSFRHGMCAGTLGFPAFPTISCRNDRGPQWVTAEMTPSASVSTARSSSSSTARR